MSQTALFKDAVSVTASMAQTYRSYVEGLSPEHQNFASLLECIGNAVINLSNTASGLFKSGFAQGANTYKNTAIGYAVLFVDVPEDWAPVIHVVSDVNFDPQTLPEVAKKYATVLKMDHTGHLNVCDTICTMASLLSLAYWKKEYATTLGFTLEELETAMIYLLATYDYTRAERTVYASGYNIQQASRLLMTKWFHSHTTCEANGADLTVTVDPEVDGTVTEELVQIMTLIASSEPGATWSESGTYTPADGEYTSWLTEVLKNKGTGTVKVNIGDEEGEVVTTTAIPGRLINPVKFEETPVGPLVEDPPKKGDYEVPSPSQFIVDYAVEGNEDDIAGADMDMATKSFVRVLVGAEPTTLPKDSVYEVPADPYAAQYYAVAYDSFVRDYVQKKSTLKKDALNVTGVITQFHKKYNPAEYLGLTKASLQKPGKTSKASIVRNAFDSVLQKGTAKMASDFSDSLIEGYVIIKPDNFTAYVAHELYPEAADKQMVLINSFTSAFMSTLDGAAREKWPEAVLALTDKVLGLPPCWIVPVATTAKREMSTVCDLQTSEGKLAHYGVQEQYDFAYKCAAVADNAYQKAKSFNSNLSKSGANSYLWIALLILLLIIITIIILVAVNKNGKDDKKVKASQPTVAVKADKTVEIQL